MKMPQKHRPGQWLRVHCFHGRFNEGVGGMMGAWLETGTRKHTSYQPLLETRRHPAVSEQSAVNENVLSALRAVTQWRRN